MPMTIIQRFNLSGVPRAPIFISAGEIVYRHNAPVSVRRANMFAGTDIFLSNINHPENDAPISGALVNNNYCTDSSVLYVAPGAAHYMTGVDIDTGVYTVKQIPPGTTVTSGLGIIRKLGIEPAARAVTTFSELGGQREASCIFPAGAVIRNDAVGSGIQTNEPYLTGHLKVGSPLRLGLWNGVDNSDNPTIFTQPSPIGGKVIGYSRQESGFPWFIEQDSSFLYYFGVNLTDRRVAYFRKKISNNVTDENIDIGLSAGGGAGTVHHDAFRLTSAFNRIHFGAYANVAGQQALIYSSPNFPIDISDSIALDTGAVSIYGIWTDPPFVYVAKGTGPTFGNQLIQIYDPALDSTRRSRRSGSEIWELIPEVGQWLM